jgi:hypothetical protein
MKRRTAKEKAKPRKQLSRPLLDNMIRDLAERIVKLEDEAEAFATIIMPNGRHTVIEHQTRLACGVMLDSLQRRIRDVRGLARLLVRDEVAA